MNTDTIDDAVNAEVPDDVAKVVAAYGSEDGDWTYEHAATPEHDADTPPDPCAEFEPHTDEYIECRRNVKEREQAKAEMEMNSAVEVVDMTASGSTGAGITLEPAPEGSEPAALTAAALGLPFLKNRFMKWTEARDEDGLRKWAGVDGDDPTPAAWSKYGQAFFWSAPQAGKFSDFKLPFAVVEDGGLRAVPSAIYAAAASVQGARNELAVPDADLPKIKKAIGSYYSKLKRTPPWEARAASSLEDWMGRSVTVNGYAASGVVAEISEEGWAKVDFEDGGCGVCRCEDIADLETDAPVEQALTAATIVLPDSPPDTWYEDPQLKKETPLTVTDDGRIYGHIADWKNCHVGYENVCMAPPRSRTDYAYFLLGETRLASGKRIPTGKITLGAGHADMNAGVKAAIEHYDNTATAVATVNAGEDDHGIWVAGALLPGVSGKDVVDLMSSPPSGDWRRVKGNLELVGAHAVNNPGYPVPRPRTHLADGRQVALVAAGAVVPAPQTPDTIIDLAALALEKVLIDYTHRQERAMAASAAMRKTVEGESCSCGGHETE